jgi:hypothetical protein
MSEIGTRANGNMSRVLEQEEWLSVRRVGLIMRTSSQRCPYCQSWIGAEKSVSESAKVVLALLWQIFSGTDSQISFSMIHGWSTFGGPSAAKPRSGRPNASRMSALAAAARAAERRAEKMPSARPPNFAARQL